MGAEPLSKALADGFGHGQMPDGTDMSHDDHNITLITGGPPGTTALNETHHLTPDATIIKGFDDCVAPLCPYDDGFYQAVNGDTGLGLEADECAQWLNSGYPCDYQETEGINGCVQPSPARD